MIAVLLAMAVAGGQGEAATPPPLTVSEWRTLPARERQIMIVGGLEGLMLAASGPRGDEAGVDQACFARTTVGAIDAKLMDGGTPEGTPIALAIVEAAGC